MQLDFINPDHSSIRIADGDYARIVDAGDPLFDELVAQNPKPYEPPPPPSVEEERAGMVASAFQTRAALYQAGLLDEVERLIAGSENFVHRLAWERAVEFRRDSPTINFLAGSVGLDDKSLDELFRLAMSIRA